MKQILVYGDSPTWGIIPGSRRRLAASHRWPIILETELLRAGHQVRVIEDALNGRRTVWEDPFKPGRNGLAGLQQRIEVNSPLALVIVMLGINDFQSVHQCTAAQSARGIAALVRAIRSAPIEPDMPVPPILIVAPPSVGVPTGDMAEKFDGAPGRSAGLRDAYCAIAAEERCEFFDAARVIATSRVDGVHLDADQHGVLGRELVRPVAGLI